MKDLFPEFDPKRSVDFNEVWADARFCFDANILLNLYRYRTNTRDELMEVLGKLGDQIWIPHHVGLEFQRNRLGVIGDQNQRFTEVRNAVEKVRDSLKAELGKLQLERRHSLIDPEPIISGFDSASNDFLAKLADAEKEQLKLDEIDPLKEKIEELFVGRIGVAPVDQKALDDLYREGEQRQARKLPPGYMDADKEKNGSDDHTYGGLIYKRKHGDFVVWRQMLEGAKTDDVKRLIFVTDDAKEDWWWIVKSDGPKTIGPRPELIEEAKRLGGVEYFHMYKPETFLAFASSYLKTDVSSEALEEVRDVSKDRHAANRAQDDFMRESWLAESAVFRWLSSRFEAVDVNKLGFPDFVAHKNGRKFGFEVKVLRSVSSTLFRLRDLAYRAHYTITEGRLDLVTIVLVASSEEFIDREQLDRIRGRLTDMPVRVRVLVGALSKVQGDETIFVPVMDFGLTADEPPQQFGPQPSEG